jgi:sugar/nucleoside kinase (ribokinase family)
MITVVGDIAVDITSKMTHPLVRGSDASGAISLHPGGSGANVAVWLARLGCPVRLIARVGNDLFGDWLVDDLKKEGVRAELVVDGALRTGVIQVLVEPDGERTMIPDRGANAHWAEGDIDEETIAASDWLHVVGYVLFDESSRNGALRAIEIARYHAVPVSVDPSSHGPLARLGAEGFWALIGKVDLLLPNRAEATALTGEEDPRRALAALRRHAGAVAIKLDAEGCLASAGGLEVSVPAEPVTVLNSTGAGDAFNAGFLSVWATGQDLLVSAHRGVDAGTRKVMIATSR